MKTKSLGLNCIYIVLAVLLFAVNSNALLIERGDDLIYDDEQDITWYDFSFDPGFEDWPVTEEWVNNLEYSGYSTWRAPTIEELQYLGLNEFRDTGAYDTTPFENVGYNGAFYLSSTACEVDERYAYSLMQDRTFDTWPAASVWGVAVKDGDVVPTPAPATIFLLTTGLCSLAAMKKRIKGYKG